MVEWRARGAGIGLAGLLVVGALGACGGGGQEAGAYGLAMPTTTTEPGEELTAEEQAFVDAGTAVCREEIGPFTNLPDLRSYEGTLDRVKALEAAVATAVLRLRELTPPPGWAERFDAMVIAVVELREALAEMITATEGRDAVAFDAAVERMDQEALEANMLSIAAGLPACAE